MVTMSGKSCWRCHRGNVFSRGNTMVPNGSEFAHRSWIRFLYFFLSTKYSQNSSEYYCICILDGLKNIQRDPIMRYNCRIIAGGCQGGELGVPGTYADSRLQIAPWRPEKIHGTWDSTYICRHIPCLCFREDLQVQWTTFQRAWLFVTLWQNAQRNAPSLNTLADLPENTSKVYAYVYRCYPMFHEFFRVFRVQFGVLSQHMYWERPIHHPGYRLAIVSRDWIALYSF